MKRFPIPHPYFFALASLLFLYADTVVVSSPSEVIRPLVVEWLILTLLGVVVTRFLHDRDSIAILMMIFVLGFYASSEYFYAAATVSVALIVLWWALSLLRKRKLKVDQISIILNLSSGLLVLIFFARFISLFGRVSWSDYRQAVNSAQANLLFVPGPLEKKPDIYYIVLDGYGRSDVLNELYGYDNSAFISYLENKGFIIPAGIHSNYPKTALSITSTLNMDYISAIAPGLDDSPFWWLMAPMIEHSRARTILEGAGYQMVAIASDWSITDISSADVYYKPSLVHLNDFEGYLLAKTPLRILAGPLKNSIDTPSFATHRQLVQYGFTTLASVPERAGPKFVFAHIVSPHPPFVFDQDGNPLHPGYVFSFNDANDFPGTREEYRKAYVAQVQFVNKQLERLVDEILAKSEVPPIIILQADHGPGMLTDFQSSENTCLRERFSPFAAYYFPGMMRESVPDDLSEVNLFRLVFNYYFGADFPLLENKYYYYKDTVYIFKAEDVTSQIDRTCEVLP